MSRKERCTQLSVWTVNLYLKYCIYIVNILSYIYVCGSGSVFRIRIQIRIQKAPEYRSGSTLVLRHWALLSTEIPCCFSPNVWKKTKEKAKVVARVGHPFFSKERNVLAFFSVLDKRTLRSLHSLRSFPFFIKEPGVLCILFRSL